MKTEKIILGTVQLGMSYGINNTVGKPALEDAFDILDYAHRMGIGTLDTAEAYGDSQSIIGAFHKSFPDKKFKVFTKLAKEANIGTIGEQVESNLLKLNVDRLDGYMLHNFWTLKENPKIYNELITIKSDRFADRIGISLYDNSEIMEVIENYEFDFIQVPFNLLDNDNHRGKILMEAKKKNIEVHTRSVFLQGLFFKDSQSLPTYLTPLQKELSVIEKIRNSHGLTMEQLAMGYVNAKEYVDKFLIGVDSIKQLKTNLMAVDKGLSRHQVFEIEQVHTQHVELLNPSNWK